MNTLSDWELIRTFAEKQSNEAFAELVRRHLGLVYASALRQVRSPDLASDVAQAVFLLLARKAPTISSKVVLSGWLFRSTRYIAACVIREESRRHRREHEAAEMNIPTSRSENELWHAVEPHLDDALATLGEKDRQVVLLRFLEGKKIREVGELLGLGENATKKRVARAIEKLRTALGRRGVAVPALPLAGVLAGAQAHAAPAGLAQALVAASAGMATKPSVAALIAGGARAWLWHQVRTGLALAGSAVAIVILSGTLWAASRGPAASSETASPPASATPNPESKTQNSKFPASPLPTRASPAPNAPVAGRRILLNVRDKVNDEPIVGAFVIQSAAFHDQPKTSVDAVTGPDGSLELTVPEGTLERFSVWVTASKHVPVSIHWEAYELKEETTLYTCHLARGKTMSGTVVNEDGEPVAGVQIALQFYGNNGAGREGIDYNPRRGNLGTDTDGHFESDRMPSDWEDSELRITFEHPDYATVEFRTHSLADFALVQKVVLLRGVSVHGHVLNLKGEPIPNVKISQDNFDSAREFRTAADGSFEIPHANIHDEWDVSSKKYAQRLLTFDGATNGQEFTIYMQDKKTRPAFQATRVHVVGTVVDADTGAPVPKFKVLQLAKYSGPFPMGEATEGKFDWVAPLFVETEYSLQVEADDYLPSVSEPRGTNFVDPEKFEFRLKRGGNVTSVVLQPDGQPAAGANVGLIQPWQYPRWQLHENCILEINGRADARTVTDATGRFTARPLPKVESIMVSHQSGFAIVPAASVTNISIVLQPWGQVEGTFLVGKRPQTNQDVWLNFPETKPAQHDFRLDYRATTDAHGHFLFTNVPPGTFFVQHFAGSYQGFLSFDHRKSVTLHAGETLHVDLAGEGRMVTGKLALAAPRPDYQWSSDLQALEQLRLDLPLPQKQDFKDKSEYQEALFMRQYQITKYFLKIQPDGTFRVDDVPPGPYELHLRLTKEPLSYDVTQIGWNSRDVIDSLDTSVNIPAAGSEAGDQPVDLGTITVPVKP